MITKTFQNVSVTLSKQCHELHISSRLFYIFILSYYHVQQLPVLTDRVRTAYPIQVLEKLQNSQVCAKKLVLMIRSTPELKVWRAIPENT